jgi:hypothetical protein
MLNVIMLSVVVPPEQDSLSTLKSVEGNLISTFSCPVEVFMFLIV